jgi:tetratricopeptide (TPR) repeat protein
MRLSLLFILFIIISSYGFSQSDKYEMIEAITDITPKEEAAIKTRQDSLCNLFNESHKKELKKLNLLIKREKFIDGIKECHLIIQKHPESQCLWGVEKSLKHKEVSRRDKLAKSDKYNKWVKKADNYFREKDYEKSKAYYIRALNLFSDKAYPKDRIVKIENRLTRIAKIEDRKEFKKAKRILKN